MTRLQEIQLEMLKEFIRICDELELKYFLVCGSALGAVKYAGFIPWDDDIDVGLVREDYNVFLNEAPKHLPSHLFLQNYLSDPEYPNIFSKLRNSETTYIEKSVSHLNINHGVYIDIFPLDGYPTRESERKWLEKRKKNYKRKLSCVFQLDRNMRGKIKCSIRRFLGYHKKTVELLSGYTEDIAKYSVEKSDVWCNHGNWQGSLEYALKEQYGEGTIMKFEGINVRVPERYDDYLTQKYGDWRAELPAEKQVGHHYYEVLDLENSYKSFFIKESYL